MKYKHNKLSIWASAPLGVGARSNAYTRTGLKSSRPVHKVTVMPKHLEDIFVNGKKHASSIYDFNVKTRAEILDFLKGVTDFAGNGKVQRTQFCDVSTNSEVTKGVQANLVKIWREIFNAGGAVKNAPEKMCAFLAFKTALFQDASDKPNAFKVLDMVRGMLKKNKTSNTDAIKSFNAYKKTFPRETRGEIRNLLRGIINILQAAPEIKNDARHAKLVAQLAETAKKTAVHAAKII